MHRDDRNMSSPPSTYYSSPPPPSTTSSDNNTQQHQQPHHYDQQVQSSLSSLESFLFLPQLPVVGDDGDEDAWLYPRHHYPRQQIQQPSAQQQQQQRSLSSSLLAIVNPTTKSSSEIRAYNNCNNNPSSFTDSKNDYHKTSCNKQFYINTTSTTSTPILLPAKRNEDNSRIQQGCKSSCSSSHVCGSKSCKSSNSLFPFIASNDTVIAAASPNNSNNDDEAATDVVVNNKTQQQKLASSMSILIKSVSSGNNSSHNHSTSPPFYLAANHYHHREERHSHDRQSHSHYRHLVRRRWLIFRICQVFSALLCMLFLYNLVKNSIWVNDEYKNKIEAVSSSLTSSSPSSRLQNRLIQSWNMPSIISSSSLLPTSAFSATFKIPEILSVASSSSRNDDHEEDNDDTNMHNLMLLDVPNFRFLMNNKTKCNIPRDDDNYFDGGDDDGASTNNHGKRASNTTSTIFFMIIVHSAPRNFEERQAIRETWGSLQRLGQFQIRLVFLLGQELNPNDVDDKDNDHNSNTSNKSNNNISNDHVADEKGDKMTSGSNNISSKHNRNTFHSKLQRESQLHGDIVTGNFDDSYRNLTYKHLMGYLWVLNHCSNAKYVLKADDDAFIDIFQLFEFLIRTFGENPEPALICNVFPEGTKPVRESDVLGKKWAVTYEEYPYDAYPKYCGGLAYLATPNVIHEIYRASRSMKNKYLFVDDVWVTGVLRGLAHVEPFYLNLRYSYDPEEYRKWLSTTIEKNGNMDKTVNSKDYYGVNDSTLDNEINGGGKEGAVVTSTANLSNQVLAERPPSSPPQKIPFMIVHVERGLQLGREMREMWNKTVTVWSGYGLIN